MLNATPFLACFARYRLQRLRLLKPAEAQEKALLGLLRAAGETRFGKEHDFAAIDTVEAFQRRVPLRRYEDFWRDYWSPGFPHVENVTWPGRVPYFAVTSGTSTGVTKYIPCTSAMVRANRRAALDLLAFHLENRPSSRILAGRNFMLAGSTGLSPLAADVLSGDLSGIAAATLPWWARLRYFPPRDLEEISNWREKIERLAPLALEADIRSISGTPSWLLLFFEKLASLSPGSERRLAEFWPDLELVAHGGVNFAPYRELFAGWLEGSRAETRETYAASEGFIAVADRGDGEGLRLILDNGLFLEFVPREELEDPAPSRHWIGDAETGIDYAVIVSSCAGIWSYVLGDTVRFADLDPPRVVVTGRVSYTLSAFGEHLIDAEIEESVATAANAIAAAVTDYSAGPIFPTDSDGQGGHLFLVEFAGGVPEPRRVEDFAWTLDAELRRTNEDYAIHRSDDYGMAAPRIFAVRPGSFAKWMEARGQLGGQHKVPRIINDETLFRELRDFMGCD
jgi:hypothetical protein